MFFKKGTTAFQGGREAVQSPWKAVVQAVSSLSKPGSRFKHVLELDAMHAIDHTHDPKLESWIKSANDPASYFPIQNLPFCVFRQPSQKSTIGVGIGDQILDLCRCAQLGLIDERFARVVDQTTINELMALSLDQRLDLRHAISALLFSRTSADRNALDAATLYQTDVEFRLPCQIGDYTDFFASLDHATNVGSMFRPNCPLLPNYKHLPVGYHGRASSIVISDTPIRRPVGQLPPATEGDNPTQETSRLLDYELEVGCLIGIGNELGQPIKLENAEMHMFGLCLLNDWSARDIQKWEYQPLGPFLAKSFATTISPWVVTLEALAPFRSPARVRSDSDPRLLDYLDCVDNSASGGFDLKLEVCLQSAQMREQGMAAIKLSSGNFANMYWTFAQMLTHHSSNGCNLRAGDLLGSGTVSGPSRDARGSMIELTWDGDPGNPVSGSQRTALKLPTGEERKFLADGDEVTLTGYCQKENYRRIGLGACSGTIIPALAN